MHVTSSIVKVSLVLEFFFFLTKYLEECFWEMFNPTWLNARELFNPTWPSARELFNPTWLSAMELFNPTWPSAIGMFQRTLLHRVVGNCSENCNPTWLSARELSNLTWQSAREGNVSENYSTILDRVLGESFRELFNPTWQNAIGMFQRTVKPYLTKC